MLYHQRRTVSGVSLIYVQWNSVGKKISHSLYITSIVWFKLPFKSVTISHCLDPK